MFEGKSQADPNSPSRPRRRLKPPSPGNTSPSSSKVIKSPAKPGGKANAEPKAKETATAKANDKTKKEKWCYVCESWADDFTTKTECGPCNNDKEASRRDMKRPHEITKQSL